MSLNWIDGGVESAKLGAAGKNGFIEELHTRKQTMQVNGYASQKGCGLFTGFGWVVLARWDTSEAVQTATAIRNFVALIGLLCGPDRGGGNMAGSQHRWPYPVNGLCNRRSCQW